VHALDLIFYLIKHGTILVLKVVEIFLINTKAFQICRFFLISEQAPSWGQSFLLFIIIIYLMFQKQIIVTQTVCAPPVEPLKLNVNVPPPDSAGPAVTMLNATAEKVRFLNLLAKDITFLFYSWLTS
jgi:hypothetical protein